MADSPHHPTSLPSKARVRADVWKRQGKVHALAAARLLKWVAHPQQYAPPRLAEPPEHYPHLVFSRSIPLRRPDPHAHPLFEEGKRHNVALAAPSFDGLLITPDHPLSFWRTLGRASEAEGFRPGMELNGGCVVPAIGGGLCLLSNALFELAATLGFRILERHGHTQEAAPPRPGALFGLDATVFWPYVDLRFAPERGEARLGAAVRDGVLVIEARASVPAPRVELSSVKDAIVSEGGERYRVNALRRRVFDKSGAVARDELIGANRKRILHAAELGRSCLTCDETGCHVRTENRRLIVG